MTRATIYLAALLHDIGKFWQRADDFFKQSKVLSENAKNLAGYMCPPNENGSFGYQHVIWTYQFLESHAQMFNSVVNYQTGLPVFRVNPFNGEHNEDSLIALAVYHHRPNTILQSIIQLADWWSSGMERAPQNMETESEDTSQKLNYGKLPYKKVFLQSLFSEIQINGQAGIKCGYKLTPLDLQNPECYFPKATTQDRIRDLTPEYKFLWETFSSEVSRLPTDSVEGFIESLTFLLKKYTWCIPSSTKDMANVSLFEHLKSTAAFADCLYVSYSENPEGFIYDEKQRRLSVKQDHYPIMMVCCDVSGIQNFIYNIASAKAAVSLKGRSFYLQLLMESVVQEFVSEFGITSGHIIYSSGGKFYLLLPNTTSTAEKLEILRRRLVEQVWKEQKTRLFICLAWIPFNYQTSFEFKKNPIFCPEQTFDGEAINTLNILWKAVSDKAALQKSKKYKHLLLSEFSTFFGNQNEGVDPGPLQSICAITGEEGDLEKLDEKDPEESIEVLKIVKTQIKLGRVLKDADFILSHKTGNEAGISYLNKKSQINVDPLGLRHNQYLFDQKQLIYDDAEWRSISSADTAHVRRINSTNFLWENKIRGSRASYGFLFYGGNEQACTIDETGQKTLKDFPQLARNEKGEATFLGVLRMDVDGLGKIFQNGLPLKLQSFASYATLSASFDYFFSGWLNELRLASPFKDHVNIIYSGGDDIFVIGRWAETIAFAEQVRTKFQEFVGGREDLSISGGMVLMHEKFPISIAAENAGAAEDQAKSFRQSGFLPKNAFTFFGETISWTSEFEYVKAMCNRLYELVKAGVLSKGFLHKLISFKLYKDYMISMENSASDIKNDYSYRWNAAYYIARYADRFEKLTSGGELLEQIKKDLFAGQTDRKFDLLALAARWAEFHLKENISPLK